MRGLLGLRAHKAHKVHTSPRAADAVIGDSMTAYLSQEMNALDRASLGRRFARIRLRGLAGLRMLICALSMKSRKSRVLVNSVDPRAIRELNLLKTPFLRHSLGKPRLSTSPNF